MKRLLAALAIVGLALSAAAKGKDKKAKTDPVPFTDSMAAQVLKVQRDEAALIINYQRTVQPAIEKFNEQIAADNAKLADLEKQACPDGQDADLDKLACVPKPPKDAVKATPAAPQEQKKQ